MDVEDGVYVEKDPADIIIPQNNVEGCDTSSLRAELVDEINGIDMDLWKITYNKGLWI